ncbi:uncharacterized protein BCR38DRAFT_471576 [Pseudomassariella vexata]|uniref:Uncharacterized protein n=1 Tax=Pseudomassariella vexata TaxID=1141098 RepID=A0A1Y2EFA5_9PEZI|nr:uncharacterized protein BCR38DRAFT_471576 [Pseudomassariella vexata]ORY70239.1 hypothetical protein BCR38DRAFT_471576 [Pseudomassariella vexata]
MEPLCESVAQTNGGTAAMGTPDDKVVIPTVGQTKTQTVLDQVLLAVAMPRRSANTDLVLADKNKFAGGFITCQTFFWVITLGVGHLMIGPAVLSAYSFEYSKCAEEMVEADDIKQ